jgi:hypothetical protein
VLSISLALFVLPFGYLLALSLATEWRFPQPLPAARTLRPECYRWQLGRKCRHISAFGSVASVLKNNFGKKFILSFGKLRITI